MNRRIIAVDNNREDLNRLVHCLETVFPDYEVISFLNPMSAVKYELNNETDAVFTEISMKNITGFDVARLMRQFRPGISVHFVSKTDAFWDEARTYHPDGFFLKPITEAALLEFLQQSC